MEPRQSQGYEIPAYSQRPHAHGLPDLSHPSFGFIYQRTAFRKVRKPISKGHRSANPTPNTSRLTLSHLHPTHVEESHHLQRLTCKRSCCSQPWPGATVERCHPFLLLASYLGYLGYLGSLGSPSIRRNDFISVSRQAPPSTHLITRDRQGLVLQCCCLYSAVQCRTFGAAVCYRFASLE